MFSTKWFSTKWVISQHIINTIKFCLSSAIAVRRLHRFSLLSLHSHLEEEQSQALRINDALNCWNIGNKNPTLRNIHFLQNFQTLNLYWNLKCSIAIIIRKFAYLTIKKIIFSEFIARFVDKNWRFFKTNSLTDQWFFNSDIIRSSSTFSWLASSSADLRWSRLNQSRVAQKDFSFSSPSFRLSSGWTRWASMFGKII